MSVDTSSLISDAVLRVMLSTARSTPPGAWVEVGVYRGGSALRLYQACGALPLHLFDTFTGIPFSDPDKGDRHGIGEFDGSWSMGTLLQRMPHARFHTGIFPDTLPPDLNEIAFVHVDCDQYRSIKDCIIHLWPRMLPGGVMWFDDYGALDGAKRAVLEHFPEDALVEAPEGRCYATCPTACAR